MNSKQIAANIRWYGIPNPTQQQKVQIRAARQAYAAETNTSQRTIGLKPGTARLDRVKQIRMINNPPPAPIVVPQPVATTSIREEIPRVRARILPPPQPKPIKAPTPIPRVSQATAPSIFEAELKRARKQIRQSSSLSVAPTTPSPTQPPIKSSIPKPSPKPTPKPLPSPKPTPKPLPKPRPSTAVWSELKSKDKYLGFNSRVYNLHNVNGLQSYYTMFRELSNKSKTSYLYVRYFNPEEGIYEYRTITPDKLQSYMTFDSYFNRTSAADWGSDPISNDWEFDPKYMRMVWYDMIGQGGNPSTIFAKIDKKTTRDPNAGCLWNAVFSQIEPHADCPIPKDIEDAEEMENLLIEHYDCGLRVYSDSITYPLREDIDFNMLTVNGNKLYVGLIPTISLNIFKDNDPNYDNYVEIVYYSQHYIRYSGIKNGLFGLSVKFDVIHITGAVNREAMEFKGLKYNGHTFEEEEILEDYTKPGYDEWEAEESDSEEEGQQESVEEEGQQESVEEDKPMSIPDVVIKRIYSGKRSKKHKKKIVSKPKKLDKGYVKHERSKVLKNCNQKWKDVTTTMVTFDVETIYDEKEHGLLKLYSISWVYENDAYFCMGSNCVSEFIDFLISKQENKKFCLLGYNSSRFDNIFLIPELLKRDLLDNVFYQNNSVLNIKWGGRHTVHDICRFANCSLATACESYKTKHRKVGGFSHAEVQRYFNEHGDLDSLFHEIKDCPLAGRQTSFRIAENIDSEHGDNLDVYLSKFLDTSEEIEKCISDNILEKGCGCAQYRKLVIYNAFDVISTLEIYTKISKVCSGISGINKELYEYKTMGSMIYGLFSDSVKDNNIELPKLSFNDYNRVRNGLFAGRTQCYYGAAADMTQKNKYRMLDVKSLYPYVALNRKYPCGKIGIMPYNKCMRLGLIGFYRCIVNQEGMKCNVIPLRSEGRPLDWTYKGDIKAFISTVDIKCILDYGGKVEICKDEESGRDDGIVFSETVDGKKLFESLEYFKGVKDTEDIIANIVKKYSGNDCEKILEIATEMKVDHIIEPLVRHGVSIKPNPALRNMAKLFLNSLTGKVVESLHIDATELVKNQKDMEKIIKKADGMHTLHPSTLFTKSMGVVSYKKRVKEVFDRDNRPIYLGCLIYAYARDHMYREILHDYDVIYQDTDSALISYDEYVRFKQNKPNSLGGEFGQFELEAGSEFFDSFVTIAPKNYFIFGNDPKTGERKLYKKGFKGVNLMNDKFIRDIEAPELKEYVNRYVHRNDTVSYNIINPFELYHFRPDLVKTVYNDIDGFLASIREKGYADVLTSSLNKSMRSGSDGKVQAGGIYQRFLLKTILSDDITDLE